jgi:hypothetical protein
MPNKTNPAFTNPIPPVVIKRFPSSNLKMEISINAMMDPCGIIAPFVANGTKNDILKTFRYILRGVRPSLFLIRMAGACGREVKRLPWESKVLPK